MIMLWTGTILEVQTNGMVKRQKKPSAWWGTMYPEFCFSEGSGDSPRKISFWLAEVLEW